MGKKGSTPADTTKMILEVNRGNGCYFICQVYVCIYNVSTVEWSTN